VGYQYPQLLNWGYTPHFLNNVNNFFYILLKVKRWLIYSVGYIEILKKFLMKTGTEHLYDVPEDGVEKRFSSEGAKVSFLEVRFLRKIGTPSFKREDMPLSAPQKPSVHTSISLSQIQASATLAA